jgi:hypothetical protein
MEGGNTTVLESLSMMMRSASRGISFTPVPVREQEGTLERRKSGTCGSVRKTCEIIVSPALETDGSISRQHQLPTVMNAYLFNAGVSQAQVRPSPNRSGQMMDRLQTWDSCLTAIVYGGDAERAQKKFEAWCCSSPEGEKTIETEIKKVLAAQFVDQLFTESGGEPPDWPKISQQVNDILQTSAVDDFEQGYWVEINDVVPPGKTSFSIEALKQGLPEDIRSGLNWSPDKKFFFLVSVLSPRPALVYPADEPEVDVRIHEDAPEENPGDGEPNLDGFVATLPDMRDKEAAALVEARNSVVAAWLWRKFAANTKLAANEIQISPCCAFLPVE